MKTTFFSILFGLLPIFIFAQNDSIKTYLFDKFEKGTVNYKNGTITGSLFNYNLFSGKIEFEQDNIALELSDLSSIASIKIGNCIFVQVKPDIFCERFIIDNVELYVYWKYTMQSAGKKGAFGSVSQTSSIADISQISRGGNIYNLQSSEEYITSKNNKYYIYMNDKYTQIDSPKSLGKLFKNHQKEIEDYCKQEKIDFRNVEDVKKVTAFCGKFVD
ncbi:hypothetical protein FACS189426_03070 [Bacteroidia bacterium]|nr:hypothetical protein FACS189426_03070 [Bacteroidia bacterium]